MVVPHRRSDEVLLLVLGDEEVLEGVDVIVEDGDDTHHHEERRESLLTVNHYELACEALLVGALDRRVFEDD